MLREVKTFLQLPSKQDGIWILIKASDTMYVLDSYILRALDGISNKPCVSNKPCEQF